MRNTERAQDLGEVFTPDIIVADMLSLLGDAAHDPTMSVLEPACGNGNFLVKVLETRLRVLENKTRHEESMGIAFIKCATLIYGVDIDASNVLECRARLTDVFKSFLGVFPSSLSEKLAKSAGGVFESNIRQGDSLNSADAIVLTEYAMVDRENFRRVPFFLEEPERDLFFVEPAALENRHYLELHN